MIAIVIQSEKLKIRALSENLTKNIIHSVGYFKIRNANFDFSTFL